MIDKDFKKFYMLKNNHPLEKKVVYRMIGVLSFFSYIFIIVGILEVNESSLDTEMWILIALVIIEKLGYLIYFYTHRQYQKWYYHLIWELFHFDPDNILFDEMNKQHNHLNQNVNNNNNNNNNNHANNVQNNANNNQKINKYNLKIPLNLLVSVIFHYSALSFIQNSDQPPDVQMKYTIISLILLFTNQVLLFQRLYFRNLITLHQYLYMVAEGLAYQYSQLSLLALIQEVGNKWYVYIIAFIFAAVSLSMILERNTHLYFTESLIYLMISQVFGLRLDAEFLYSKHNDRCQKIFSYILYGCFSILFWISLLLLVIIFGGSKLYYLNYSIPIGIMATALFFLLQVIIIVRYVWKSPLRLGRNVSSNEDIEQLRKMVNPLTKIMDLSVQLNNTQDIINQSKMVESLVTTLLFTQKDILYSLSIWNHQKEYVMQVESVYDSQKIRVLAVRMYFENIPHLELICTQIQKQKFNYYEFIVNLQNVVSVKNQAIRSLIKYPMICMNINKQSNIVRADESFHNHCVFMRQTLNQIIAMHKHIQYVLYNNPYSIYYDLFDDLTEQNNNHHLINLNNNNNNNNNNIRNHQQ